MKLEAQSLRRALLLGTVFLTGIAGYAGAASALTLQEAVGLIISTNPEVGVTVKDRRAIDYELLQARALYYPQIDSGSTRASISLKTKPPTSATAYKPGRARPRPRLYAAATPR